MRYTIAHKLWNFGKWIWMGLLIAIFINYAANIAPTPAKDFASNFSTSVLGWFFSPGLNRILTFIVLGLIISLPIIAWFITTREKHSKYNEALQHYLHAVIEANQGLNPRGFSQSQALISVNVPLNDIFIHLYAVPDRPVYDLPSEQQKLLEELRKRVDLSLAEREELIQRLRVVWYSQLGQGFVTPPIQLNQALRRTEAPPSIEQVIEQLTIERPVAVLLGAPGSGKSTAMRWLALYMAHASLSLKAPQPYRMYPDQLPIFLRINEYAKRLSIEEISIEQYFKDYFAKLYPDLSELPVMLFDTLRQERCLVLFDGLDEVASDNLRRKVAENIYEFISDYTSQKRTGQFYNRFIITSRIVGYEPGAFARYPHYTLLELEDQQINQFLTNWCPAVERYQTMFAQGMKPLTPQQEKQAISRGIEQRNRLLEAIQNTGIKRLAVNPLMLTILALIQRSGRTLPHQRVELYQIVTRTLLDNWNKESGRRVFPIEELPLAEQLLDNLAYRLHSSDPLLTEQDVKSIVRQTMADFYQREVDQIKESSIQEFIETLRSSSGLFVESGQGLFSFMHRTFQEYFVALHLLRKSPEDLKRFILEHYRTAIWREPLLLAIAYKSGQNSRDERLQASELIQEIALLNDKNDAILHQSLLFAASSIADCNAWSIDRKVQYHIANALFDLYGDPFEAGRYISLQRKIEQVILLWLKGQPQINNQQTSLPPLLETWHEALCNTDNVLRQQGSVQLIAYMVPDIIKYGSDTSYSFIAPLIQIAGISEFPIKEGVKIHLPKITVRPANLIVEDFALIALRLFDTIGPAGWLHDAWIIWNEEKPELLQSLAQHMNELNLLLTPASLPNRIDSDNREIQHNIFDAWRNDNEYNTGYLQLQLLNASNSARFPHAYLFKQMLDREQKLSTSLTTQPWQYIWDSFLQAEMARGRSITYLSCLSLRLLLGRDDQHKIQEIADELVKALTAENKTQIHALLAISYISLPSFQKNVNIQPFDYTIQAWNFRFLLEALDTLEEMPSRPTRLRPYHREGYHKVNIFGYSVHTILRAPTVKVRLNKEEEDPFENEEYYEGPEEEFLTTSPRPIYLAELRDLRDLRDIQENLPVPRRTIRREIQQSTSLQMLMNLHDTIDYEEVTNILCNLLLQPSATDIMLLILTLASMLSYSSISTRAKQKLLNAIQDFNSRCESQKREDQLLVTSTIQLLQDKIGLNQTSFARQKALQAIKHKTSITESEARMLMLACKDARQASIDDSNYFIDTTIQEIAWEILSQQFDLDLDALPIIIEALEHKDTIVCAAAALLLQHSKTLPLDKRQEVIEKITIVLKDDQLSLRALEPPNNTRKTWRLCDVLFETLQILEEKSNTG